MFYTAIDIQALLRTGPPSGSHTRDILVCLAVIPGRTRTVGGRGRMRPSIVGSRWPDLPLTLVVANVVEADHVRMREVARQGDLLLKPRE